MARRDQYIKSTTDFVLRRKHAVTTKGTIYENDHMTILPDDDIYNEDIAMFSDSNFKFRVRTDINNKKKHFSGEWVKPDGEEGEYWSYDSSSTTVSSESKIELKPNYTSLTDFAYYGSAEELVKATVKDVILRYPAGIYYFGSAANKVDGKYRVANEFKIDICTPNADSGSVENPLRVLSASMDKYVDGQGNPITGLTITPKGNSCPNSIICETKINGITLYTYLTDEGETITLTDTNSTGCIIRLNDIEFKKAYDALDDFEKVLLPLDTNPPFTAKFMTPYFSGQDYRMSLKTYRWPVVPGTTSPDISSAAFNGYITGLISLAKFHDENDSDNIWRMLTHPSLKNLDWTFMRREDGEDVDMSNFDTSRLKGVLELYGRSFDDIKRAADNIKYTNAISYDEKNNVPDYFLSDCVENDGWDAYYIGPTKDNSIVSPILFSAYTSGFTAADANTTFFRELALSSDYIQSMKGTKRGIETILALFGFSASEYTISEYIAAADKFPSEMEVWAAAAKKDDYYYGDDVFSEWPIIMVEPEKSASGTENGGDEEEVNRYAIPWYDKTANYISGLYFQQKGGWENVVEKKISLPQITTESALTPMGSIDLYNETLPYMRYAENLNELTALTTTRLFSECVCYVKDISGLSDLYKGDSADSSKNNYSHYFILKNVELSPHLGFVDNEYYSCYGWRNVFVDEFDGTGEITCDGLRVLYCESITSIEIGNNPHVGYGFYDMGEDYLEHFRQIFKFELENDMFSSVKDSGEEDSIEEIKEIGFGDVEAKKISRKTVAFTETQNGDAALTAMGLLEGSSTTDKEIGSSTDDNDTDVYSLFFIPEQESVSDKFNEAASLSIINVKNIEIDFKVSNEYVKKYIEDVVMRYIEQMMPSTAIFSYKFSGAVAGATPDQVAMTGTRMRAKGDAVKMDSENTYLFEYPLPPKAE